MATWGQLLGVKKRIFECPFPQFWQLPLGRPAGRRAVPMAKAIKASEIKIKIW
jgi:hypothetical protein